MKVSAIKKNQNNPRQIKGEKLELLKASVGGFQKMMALRPIIIDENNVVLGGNMRLAAIKALGLKEIPDEWVKRADDLSEDEKKEFIIKDNAGFGEWDWDVIANEWSDEPLSDWGLDVPGFEAVEEFGDAESSIEYSKKIEAPIYQITGERPEIKELCDDSRERELIAEIVASDAPDEIKDFLIAASRRHCVFNYEKIAEFYAHADATIQGLFERSALVIIDFDKAIESGYVEVGKQIADLFAEEYPS